MGYKPLYSAQNLPENVLQVVQQSYSEAMATAEGALLGLDYLKSAIQNYKDSLANRINTSLQKADLTIKYTHNQPGNSYNLPGVFSSTTGGYDIAELQKDKAALESIIDTNTEAIQATNTYYKMVSYDMNDLRNKLQKIGKLYNDLLSYIDQIETYSKGNMKI